jgi:phenylacetate-CoA ligase
VFADGRLAGQYQLVVTRPDRLDELAVRVELLPAHRDADRDAVGQALQGRIKAMTGVTATVDVGLPESIERTLVGKARRVVDQRQR